MSTCITVQESCALKHLPAKEAGWREESNPRSKDIFSFPWTLTPQRPSDAGQRSGGAGVERSRERNGVDGKMMKYSRVLGGRRGLYVTQIWTIPTRQTILHKVALVFRVLGCLRLATHENNNAYLPDCSLVAQVLFCCTRLERLGAPTSTTTSTLFEWRS